MHCHWGMPGQSAQTVVASKWERNECWQFPSRSVAARNSFRLRMNREERHPAKFGCQRLRAIGRFQHSHQAHFGALSRRFQTAPPFAHARTHRGVRISAKCSGCGRMPARPRAIRDSFYSARKPILPMLPTTVNMSWAADKPCRIPCNLLNNRVLAKWARAILLGLGGIVASYPQSGIPCVAGWLCRL